ncbi:DUF447 domain-containing protein [Rubinisphaera margarita]|uniref:DUF447 domain-containing protein n=1 Tax=Rubinisphaera margarita TaxID=2909586 RepID=UPI001EE782FE|nr:DUF447 domain-containing protein [Rubinisphaera margarita]MCG6158081.1 DUF447 family protein [Rubinisphaera margarita]
MPYVLEGLVTTLNEDASVNLAPMGPIPTLDAEGQIQELIFRPFPESRTYRNLIAHPEGVFHVTDRVLPLAQAISRSFASTSVDWLPTKTIHGRLFPDACQAYEFRIRNRDETGQRMVLTAEVVQSHNLRPFLGFNRGAHAVIEAAILASRLHILERNVILHELDRLKVLIEKTADAEGRAAFDLLVHFIHAETQQTGNHADSARDD